MIKYLEKASELDPVIVRNAPLDASFSPNSLAAINYLSSRASNFLNYIINKLDEPRGISNDY